MNVLYSVYQILVSATQLILPFIHSKKIKKWRQGIQDQIIKKGNEQHIWFHIASSGEFEQAKPVIELLKKQGKDITVTFFSPSGFEAQKNNPLLDAVYYLPFDTRKNMRQLVQTINPTYFILVKYELWLNLMHEINRANVPAGLISGVFPKNHFLFSWYGKAHLHEIKQFQFIAVQDEESADALAKKGIETTITGDTRIDRSLELPREEFKDSIIEQFIDNQPTMVLGSAWQPDIELFLQILSDFPQIKFIIAPHELHSDFISKIQHSFLAGLYSKQEIDKKSLIIDQIGILKYIYRYADIAYIGGGFGKGIHNTLEPASYAIPVLFGPNYHKFVEAKQLIECGGAFSIQNADDLRKTLTLLLQDENRMRASKKAKNYLEKYQGASRRVVELMRNRSIGYLPKP